MRSRLRVHIPALFASFAVFACAVFAFAAPASAAVPSNKPQLLASFTQATTASRNSPTTPG